MHSAAERNLHVFTQDWRSLLRRHCDKMNAGSTSLPNKAVAIGGLDVLHPIGPRAEHGYEVAFALDSGYNHRGQASAVGCTPANFEGRLESRWEPKAGPPTLKPVDPPPRRVGRQLR